MIFDLRKYWKRSARDIRKKFANRLLRGLGVGGKTLRPKKSRRRPLGFDSSPGGIPARLNRGRIRVRKTGFSIVFDKRTGYWQRGSRKFNRPQRIVAYLTKGERQEVISGAVRVVARQLQAALRKSRSAA